jgi:hypothetical protein
MLEAYIEMLERRASVARASTSARRDALVSRTVDGS